MSVAGLLNQRASISRARVTVDAGGETVTTWEVVAEGVPCRVERLSTQPGGLDGGTGARAYFPAGVDLSGPGKERRGERVTAGGIVYRVMSVGRSNGARVALISVDLETEA